MEVSKWLGRLTFGWLGVMLLLALIGAIVGCGPANKVESKPNLPGNWERGVQVYTDPLTGCAYLRPADYYGGGFTVRLDKDGWPMCPGGTKDER